MQSIVSGLSNINLVAGYFAGRLQDFTELFEFTDALKVYIHAAGVCPHLSTRSAKLVELFSPLQERIV